MNGMATRTLDKPVIASRWMRIMLFFIGGFGGIYPDFDHFLYTITQGQTDWGFLHSIYGICGGILIALCCGLLYQMVLKRAAKRNEK